MEAHRVPCVVFTLAYNICVAPSDSEGNHIMKEQCSNNNYLVLTQSVDRTSRPSSDHGSGIASYCCWPWPCVRVAPSSACCHEHFAKHHTHPLARLSLSDSTPRVATIHQFCAIVGQFFLGTGRVPGWSPTPPLASCHRDTNRAVSGLVLGQFWKQIWALPGRPGAAREAQNRILTITKVPIRPTRAYPGQTAFRHRVP